MKQFNNVQYLETALHVGFMYWKRMDKKNEEQQKVYSRRSLEEGQLNEESWIYFPC